MIFKRIRYIKLIENFKQQKILSKVINRICGQARICLYYVICPITHWGCRGTMAKITVVCLQQNSLMEPIPTVVLKSVFLPLD